MNSKQVVASLLRLVRESQDDSVTLPRNLVIAVLEYAQDSAEDAERLRRDYQVSDKP